MKGKDSHILLGQSYSSKPSFQFLPQHLIIFNLKLLLLFRYHDQMTGKQKRALCQGSSSNGGSSLLFTGCRVRLPCLAWSFSEMVTESGLEAFEGHRFLMIASSLYWWYTKADWRKSSSVRGEREEENGERGNGGGMQEEQWGRVVWLIKIGYFLIILSLWII